MCVCACVSLNYSFLLIATAVRGRFPQTRYLRKPARVGEPVGRVFSSVVSRWSRSPVCCGFRGVFFWCLVGFPFFFRVVFSSNAHYLLQVRGNLAFFTSLLVPVCVQGAIILLVCLSVCVCVCDIEFVVFTDYESCTRPISTNPVSMKAGEYMG